ncbi:MAG: hypothetical protein GY711_04960 [bacterium]|nr:hypothetical protein [bacterium]
MSGKLILPLAALVLVPLATAQERCTDTRLIGSQAQAGSQLGRSISIDGDRMLVGSNHSEEAYVFERQGGAWVETARFTPTTADPLDRYGIEVHLRGRFAYVAAPNVGHSQATGPGQVHVYESVGGAWIEHPPIVASDGMPGDVFGRSIDSSGALLLIGMEGGAAYVFAGDPAAPTEIQKLTNTLGVSPYFGYYVAIDGERLIVGNFGGGEVSVFERMGNQFIAQALINSDTGKAMDLTGDRLVFGRTTVGTPYQSGLVFVYERDPSGAWNQIQQFTSPTPSIQGNFGAVVVADGDDLYVTEARRDAGHQDTGSVHQFRFDGASYQPVYEFVPSPPQFAMSFGRDVAVSDGRVAIAAWREDTPAENTGAAHIFWTGPTGHRTCVANPNSSGSAASIDAFGCEPLITGTLELGARLLPQNEFGYFLMSSTQAFLPLFGGSDGNLCLGLPLQRFAQDILSSGEGGDVYFPLDLGALPGQTTLAPGETWTFQYWYRDGAGSNTTDAVAVTFETGGDPSTQFPGALAQRSEDAATVEALVTLSQATGSDVGIPFTVGGTALPGADFDLGTTSPLVIPAGATSAAIELTLLDDTEIEGTERVTLALDPPTGAVLGSQTVYELTILDND